ncbi:hypothetical protein ACWERI_15255 [Streptomyces collinus]
MDLKYMVERTGSVARVADARRIDTKYDVLVGADGAIAATRCKSEAGDHFALTLQLPKIKPGDRAHRGDIERFMRAYFPATLRTLGCG